MIPKDANRRRLFIMRHGSVTYFDDAGKPVPPDTVPLNERGIRQAEAAGELFAKHKIKFDRIIVSGLLRTVQTAEHILHGTGQQISIETKPSLQEIKGGKLSEIPAAQLHSAFRDVFGGYVSEDERFLGGESVGELLDRVIPEIDQLRSESDWDVTLLVLHGGVNRAILSYLASGKRLMLGSLAQAPACINAVDVGAAQSDVVIRAMNISPTDYLQIETRKTTMEALYEQYEKYRNRVGEKV